MTTGEQPFELDRLVREALREDMGRGDLTTRVLFPDPVPARARIIARQDLVAAGLDIIPRVFFHTDPSITVETSLSNGQRVAAGEVMALIKGDGRGILTGERVALNFIQHLSGIATLTSVFVEALRGFKARLLDTRKTLPGWRVLEKQAVRLGGGLNHRMGLDDAILIKDNHISLFGGIGAAIRAARSGAPPLSKIMVEARTMEELAEALREGAPWILLDNMSPDQLRAAVEQVKGRAITEASGGVSLKTIKEIAASGVDYISVGEITHSDPACDISLDLVPGGKRRNPVEAP